MSRNVIAADEGAKPSGSVSVSDLATNLLHAVQEYVVANQHQPETEPGIDFNVRRRRDDFYYLLNSLCCVLHLCSRFALALLALPSGLRCVLCELSQERFASIDAEQRTS